MPFDKCPQCGFTESTSNRPFSPGMWPFWNKTTGEKVAMQHENKSFTIPATETKPEITFLNEKDYLASKQPPKVIPAPSEATPKQVPTA